MEGHPTRQIPMWPLTFRMYKELLLNTKKKKTKTKTKNKKQKMEERKIINKKNRVK